MTLFMTTRKTIVYQRSDNQAFFSANYGVSFNEIGDMDKIVDHAGNVVVDENGRVFYFEGGSFTEVDLNEYTGKERVIRNGDSFFLVSVNDTIVEITKITNEAYREVNFFNIDLPESSELSVSIDSIELLSYMGDNNLVIMGTDPFVITIDMDNESSNLHPLDSFIDLGDFSGNDPYILEHVDDSFLIVDDGSNINPVYQFSFDGSEITYEKIADVRSGHNFRTMIGGDGESALWIGDNHSVYTYKNGEVGNIVEYYDNFNRAGIYDRNNFIIEIDANQEIYAWY